MMSLPCLFRPPLKSPSFQGSRSSLSAILLTGILCSPLICPAAESDPAPAAESQPAASAEPATAVDHVRQLQTEATLKGHSPIAHWGTDPAKYQQWGSHSNRLIPVYTFGTKGGGDGLDLNSLTGPHSTYRSEEKLRQLYGHVPVDTVSDKAEYLDQTDIYGLQKAALAAGRKYIFLVVFDGMDWQTTQAAAIVRRQQVPYTEGRGQGLHFQDYAANGTSQFGWMVTSPHNQGTKVDVNTQTISNPGGVLTGGYDPARGGPYPWSVPQDPEWHLGKQGLGTTAHAYTDSASSATSMTAGIKTYNAAINVDATGQQVSTIALEAHDLGLSTGAVTSVPISHATPAATAAHNVHRGDYQDLSRDLLGLKSISHPQKPLPGLDVLIGAGAGVSSKSDRGQGENFVPGNRYLADSDLAQISLESGGRYVVSVRTPEVAGGAALKAAAKQAAEGGHRLFGYYGTGEAHLPYQTANGDFQPAPGRAKAEVYSPADLDENPTLSDMTEAALTVLARNPKGFWLLVEAGDVDWANHDNNLDNSIGAVFSGEAAIRVVTDWVEQHSSWEESLLIVTADHGHFLVLDQPEALVRPRATPAPAAAAGPSEKRPATSP